MLSMSLICEFGCLFWRVQCSECEENRKIANGWGRVEREGERISGILVVI